MSDYNVTETELVRMGFRLGSMYETYRMDGMSDGTYFYLQVELMTTGAVRCTIYGETPPLAGAWLRLDTRELTSADEVRELVGEVFDDIYEPNQSLIRMAMPLTYYETRA